MDIKLGDVLFVWGNGPIDHIIEGVTDGPSHMAIFKNEKTVIEAQAGRLVGEQDLSFYLNLGCRMEVWTDPGMTDEQRQQMLEFATTLYGLPYDYLLIPLEFLHFEVGMKLNWYHENKHVICSSLACDLSSRVGRKWTEVANPAPVDPLEGGVLQKKFDLTSESLQAS